MLISIMALVLGVMKFLLHEKVIVSVGRLQEQSEVIVSSKLWLNCCFLRWLKIKHNLESSLRSSYLQIFYKVGVLKNFPSLTGKHLLLESLFIKSFCKFCWKETQTQVFSCEFCKIFESTYFIEYLEKAVSVALSNNYW